MENVCTTKLTCEHHISSMTTRKRGKTLELNLSLVLLPRGELNSLLEKAAVQVFMECCDTQQDLGWG